MFRFEHPNYLYLLLLVPILLALFLYRNFLQKHRLKKYGNPALLAQLMPSVSPARQVWHIVLQLFALTLCVFMLAGPQFGSKLEKIKRQGSELMIALDVSRSMNAQDIAPSRMDKAKQTLSKLIDELSNDKIGLIVFAGDAYTQLPITADYVSAKMFLNTISTDMVPVQGTAIGKALELAMRSFGAKTEADRAIVVITDGENHEDDALAKAKACLETGVRVHVIGMGQPKGAPIPLGRANDFHKDKEGNVVISKLNEDMCRQIAQAGGGLYVRSDNSNAALKMLLQELGKMNQADIETTVYTEYDDQFPSLAWVMLFILLVDMFILERRNDKMKNIKLF